jgi:hypothetical protein
VVESVSKESERLAESLTLVQQYINDLSRKAEQIAESTSTQFVAVFPDNLPAITKLVSDTRKSLVVVCDFAGYGHYSNPHHFLDYKQALERLAAIGDGSRPDIEVIVYGAQHAQSALDKQLLAIKGIDWERFRGEHLGRAYAKLNPQRMAKALQSSESFVAMIAENEAEHRRQFVEMGLRVCLLEREMPFYFWVSDGKQAIISFIAYNPLALEYSFTTKDQRLIQALLDIVQDYDARKELACAART